MDIETSFNLIAYFKDNLVFAQDYESLNVCYFENNIFCSIYKFDFNNSKLCILKNNDIIICGKKKIWKETKCDDGRTYKYCTNSFYFYSHYEFLNN